jgi:catechol 2,3-dioxygenase-like lactoylglutathione lyase family enzyme
MIDHIDLPVTNIKRSLDFYGALSTPLGKADRWKFEAKAGYLGLDPVWRTEGQAACAV